MSRSIAFALVLLAGTAIGCKGGSKDEARAKVAAVAEREADAFFDSLLSAAQKGEVDAIDAHFDWDAMAKRASRGLPTKGETIRGIGEESRADSKAEGLSAMLAKRKDGKVSVRRLGTRVIDGETYQMVRILEEDGGFEHLGFLLDKKGNETRTVDLWRLMSGETWSEVLRRRLLSQLPEESRTKLEGKDRLFADNVETLVAVESLASQGNGHDALHMLETLPEELQTERFLSMMRVGLAVLGGPAEHFAALEALAENHPDDPAAQFQLVDGYVLHGMPEKSLEALDRFEALAPADPFVDVIRANLFAVMTRWSEAREVAERAVSKEPDLEEAYWPILVASAMERDFENTTKTLLLMRERFDVKLDPREYPFYAEYLESPEYQRFLEATAE